MISSHEVLAQEEKTENQLIEEFIDKKKDFNKEFEYGFRIAEPLGLVVFYDWGFVNENDFDFSMSNYADNWGVGARIMLMGSPLKLDLGIPITSPEGVGGGTQFNFSFGTRF